MSSFNINNIPSSQPMIQSSQGLGKDGGGGGQTGYMNMRGKKKKKQNGNEEEETNVFDDDGHDTFERESEIPPAKEPLRPGSLTEKLSHLIKIRPVIGYKPKKADNDSFSKSTPQNENNITEEKPGTGVFSKYNVKFGNTLPPIEDNEYEIADDYDYYNQKTSTEEQEEISDSEEIIFYEDE